MIMNWEEIKEKYSKSFELLIKNHNLDYYTDETQFNNKLYYNLVDFHEEFNIRDLYDFFDEQGLYIDIDCESIVKTPLHWTFTIDKKGKGHSGEEVGYINRKEAEKVAFEKAFELLEERL